MSIFRSKRKRDSREVDLLLDRCASLRDSDWLKAGHRYALLVAEGNPQGRVNRDFRGRTDVEASVRGLRLRALRWWEACGPGSGLASDEYAALSAAVVATGAARSMHGPLRFKMLTPLLSVLREVENSRESQLLAAAE